MTLCFLVKSPAVPLNTVNRLSLPAAALVNRSMKSVEGDVVVVVGRSEKVPRVQGSNKMTNRLR